MTSLRWIGGFSSLPATASSLSSHTPSRVLACFPFPLVVPRERGIPVVIRQSLAPSSARSFRLSPTRVHATQTPGTSAMPLRFDLARFERVKYCLVYSPQGPPSAVINFVGGSFIGAAPDLFYSHYIKLLVDQGFLVLATLYDVSLDHTCTAASVQGRFRESWESLQASGLPSAGLKPGEISELPIFGVGHSLGALMLALIGTQEDLYSLPGAPRGNVIVSYTDRATNTSRGFNQPSATFPAPLQSLLVSASGVLTAGFEQSLGAFRESGLPLSELATLETLDPLLRFSGSFAPAMNDAMAGVLSYSPTPEDNLREIALKYSVPLSLIMQCEEDDWENSPAVERAMRERGRTSGIQVDHALLPGTHFTAAAPDVVWRVGDSFTPADALAAAAKASYLVDIRGMASSTGLWIKSQI